MVTFTLVLCTEPYKYEGIDSMLNLADEIVAKGHKIRGIFLFGSGVYNIKREINTGKDIRNLPERLESFSKNHSIRVVACSTWVSLSGLKPEEFLEGAAEEGLGDLSNWAAESDRMIVFGAGG